MSEHLTQKAFFEWAAHQRFAGIDRLQREEPKRGQTRNTGSASVSRRDEHTLDLFAEVTP